MCIFTNSENIGATDKKSLEAIKIDDNLAQNPRTTREIRETGEMIIGGNP